MRFTYKILFAILRLFTGYRFRDFLRSVLMLAAAFWMVVTSLVFIKHFLL